MGNVGKDVIDESLYARFRAPRYIDVRNIIKPYDEESSMVFQILKDIQGGHYANSTLKYFCQIPETNRQGELVNPTSIECNSLIIITDEHFLFIKINKETSN